MTVSEKDKYYRIVTDCWRMFLKYQNPVEADEFWENLIKDANEIYEKHQKSDFCKKLLLAVLDEIEIMWKKIR